MNKEELIKRQNLFLIPHLKGPISKDNLDSYVGLPIYIKDLGEWGILSYEKELVIIEPNIDFRFYPKSRIEFELYTFPIFDVENAKLALKN